MIEFLIVYAIGLGLLFLLAMLGSLFVKGLNNVER
jgi:hypothetical protein